MTTSRGDFRGALARVSAELRKLTKKPTPPARKPRRARTHTPPRAPEPPLELPFAPEPEGIEVRGQPLPPPPPTPAPLDGAVLAAAVVAHEKAIAAEQLAAHRLEVDAAAKWKGSCNAVCALTGRRCRLPAHPEGEHRSERGPFRVVAAPGQTHFARQAALDEAATAGGDHESMYDKHSGTQQQRFLRRLKRAHLGADTTTGDETNQQRRAATQEAT